MCDICSWLIDLFMVPSIVSAIISGVINIWIINHQKLKLDKIMEDHRYQLQVDFLKSKLKADQLVIIYPQLYKLIKEAEGSLVRLSCLRKNKQLSSEELKNAENNYIEANNYLTFNALFFSKEVEDNLYKLKDLMGSYLYETEDVQFAEIAKNIDILRDKLRKELETKEDTKV